MGRHRGTIAEAGLERGLHLFYLEFTCGPLVTSPITPANCANPPANPNYITDNKLARISLATACPASLLPDGATGFKQLELNQTFAGGTYTVCIRPDPDAPTNQVELAPNFIKAPLARLELRLAVLNRLTRIKQLLGRDLGRRIQFGETLARFR